MYLNCKTNFSFRYGTFKTEELVAEAESLGVTTMAITNINNTCDVWDFVDHCNEAGIKPVAGAEITTRFAPAVRWPAALSLSVKKPVHSSTTSTS